MTLGPGMFDHECQAILDSTPDAELVMVMVGSTRNPRVAGFSASMLNPEFIHQIPAILRSVADQIEVDAGHLRN